MRNIERALATRARPHAIDHRACCALRIDRRLADEAAPIKEAALLLVHRASDAARAQMTSASLAGRSILVIEDERLIAVDIRQTLERESARVQTAQTRASASQLLQHDDLSAAIVDFAFADGDAGEICALLEMRRIPFILHSGYQHGCDHGAAAILPKPALPSELLSALLHALSNGTPENDRSSVASEAGMAL